MTFAEVLPGLLAGETVFQTTRRYSCGDGVLVYWRFGRRADSPDGPGLKFVVEYSARPDGRFSGLVAPYELRRRDFERDDWEFGAFVAPERKEKAK